MDEAGGKTGGKKITARQMALAAAEVERRRNNKETYSKPLGMDACQTEEEFSEVKEFMKYFYKNYYCKKRQKEREELVRNHPEVAAFFRILVPAEVTEEEFWQRYEYRCDQARIARLAAGRSNSSSSKGGGGGGGDHQQQQSRIARLAGGRSKSPDNNNNNEPSTTTTTTTERYQNDPTTRAVLEKIQSETTTDHLRAAENVPVDAADCKVSSDTASLSSMGSTRSESVVSRTEFDMMQKMVESLTAQLSQTHSLLAEMSSTKSPATTEPEELIEFNNCNNQNKKLDWNAVAASNRQQKSSFPSNANVAGRSERGLGGDYRRGGGIPRTEERPPPVRHIVVSANNKDGGGRGDDSSQGGISTLNGGSLYTKKILSEDSIFGDSAADLASSVMSSIESKFGGRNNRDQTGPTKREKKQKRKKFYVTAPELAELSNERTHLVLGDVLAKGLQRWKMDNESLSSSSLTGNHNMAENVGKIIKKIRESEMEVVGDDDIENKDSGSAEVDKNASNAANALAHLLLNSTPRDGIDTREVEQRKKMFGTNTVADNYRHSFFYFWWKALSHDFVCLMLIALGAVSIFIETVVLTDDCATCWVDGVAILGSVFFVTTITSSIDFSRQYIYMKLSRELKNTSTNAVIRNNGKQLRVMDKDIVVGDIVCVNSHSFTSIPADCLLLGTASSILKVNESMLTGEVEVVRKKAGDVLLSGTNVVEGSGIMVVISVGINSVAGKIKTRVYDSENTEMNDDQNKPSEDVETPLFDKLDILSKQIGLCGTVAALVLFYALCFQGLIVDHDSPRQLVGYLINTITVLAIAVPEGLPLVVKLILTLSANKMTREHNLVKNLSSCETMGSVTTVLTDKTGTLTANKMTARACFAAMVDYYVEDPNVKLSNYMKQHNGGVSFEIVDLICRTIAIDTMDETTLYFDNKGRIQGNSGNPTEVALLTLAYDLGGDYDSIRKATKGRSGTGMLRELLSEGRQFGFASARKMMSWVVPIEGGGYRVYCKGAYEVLISRSERYLTIDGTSEDLRDSVRGHFSKAGLVYTEHGMRCLGLAYRDLPAGFDLESFSEIHKDLDGTQGYEVETKLTLIALIGIEDPLRPEVPRAIKQCYQAGIDVRLVTGDNPDTAVNIAYQAGILQDFHFKTGEDKVLSNLKRNVLMEGTDFRRKVYRIDANGVRRFDQAAFDRIWPYLRVLARSSPNDKLALAHGMSQSTLFADERQRRRLAEDHDIVVYPDRQFVAVTGDGTNDAPALMRADVGFAMGISGTQLAKDAADIILMDDNFASIVASVKFGRNVFVSIRKFLQFQLTACISCVVIALLGVFLYEKSPLAPVHLLWLNLLVHSLASIALASEPPTEDLLHRSPVSKCDAILTTRMYANIIGQGLYQIVVILVLLFQGPRILDIEDGHYFEELDESSLHYTIIFNTFIWMQLFNQINCRNIDGGVDVFSGILDNQFFCLITATTAFLQVIIVQYGSVVFHVVDGGLDLRFWIISLLVGFGSILVQQLINILYYMGSSWILRESIVGCTSGCTSGDKANKTINRGGTYYENDDGTLFSATDSQIVFDEFPGDIFSEKFLSVPLQIDQSMLKHFDPSDFEV